MIPVRKIQENTQVIIDSRRGNNGNDMKSKSLIADSLNKTSPSKLSETSKSPITSKTGPKSKISSVTSNFEKAKRDHSARYYNTASKNVINTDARRVQTEETERSQQQLENATGIEAYNKKVSARHSSAKPEQPTYQTQAQSNSIYQNLLKDTSNRGEDDNQSLVQISRNTTVATMGSTRQHILSPTCYISSSSSDELAIHNSDSFPPGENINRISSKNKIYSNSDRISSKSNKSRLKADKSSIRENRFNPKNDKFNSKANDKQTKEFSNSVSENPIDREFDNSCPISSCLGIVSSENKLGFDNNAPTEDNGMPSPRKKRVSLSYPSEKPIVDQFVAQQIQYHSISGAIPPSSIGTPSLEIGGECVSEAEILMRKFDSISKCVDETRFDTAQYENKGEKISDVDFVSKDCGLNTATLDSEKYNKVEVGTDVGKMYVTPSIKDINYGNKSSQNEACECWKVCTCKSGVNDGCVNPLALSTCGHAHQIITCVITNTGTPPKHYTANYSFGYDNTTLSQDPKT